MLGDPPASVVAFAAEAGVGRLNVLEVGDKMEKRGWHLNGLSGPAAVHIAVTVGVARTPWSTVADGAFCFCFGRGMWNSA